MQFNAIHDNLIQCLHRVLDQDNHLLHHDINEPAISHRLALYLTPLFPDYNVDCEYNGNVDGDKGRKYVILLTEKARQLGLKRRRKDENKETTARAVFPDIIIHRRGLNGADNNVLVIEIKKSSSQVTPDWDVEKLTRFTSPEYENQYNYRFGAFVRLQVGEQPNFTVEWFKDGERYVPVPEG